MVVTDAITTSLAIIQAILAIRAQIQYNRKQCNRLLDRLSTVVPMLRDWQRNHPTNTSTSTSNKNKFHTKTLQKFTDFLRETHVFVCKFTDSSMVQKIFSRNIDNEQFADIASDLSHFIQELQLGVALDTKQCQEEDVQDRQQDFEDLYRIIAQTGSNNQQMMDLMMQNMQQMMAQMMSRVDQAISSTSSCSSLSSASSGMTDAELDDIESKIESIASLDGSTASSSSSSKKAAAGISLDDLKMIAHSDVVYSTDASSGSFIGGGTFGDVYRGKYKGNDVAIKVLKDNTAMAMSALKKEAYAMQLLCSCKHMMAFHGVRVDSKPYYIVMELGQCSLYDLLYDDTCPNKLPREATPDQFIRKLKVLYDVIHGIEFLHNVKVIHRDIKPMNIMLSGTGVMKLTDFGSAKMKDVGASTNGLAKGTPAYMAPEIILADDPDAIEYTDSTDIYAFGVVMNEVLDHAKPFDGLKGIQIIRALDKGSRPKLFKADDDLTATGDGYVLELQVLIDRCWHETPAKRPCATSITKKLGRLGGFKSVAVPSPSPPPPPPRPSRNSAVAPSVPKAAPAVVPITPPISPAASVKVVTSTPAPASVKVPQAPAPAKASTSPITPPIVDPKAKQISDLLESYEEAYRYFGDIRFFGDFERIDAMKRLSLANSRSSCFISGFVLICQSIKSLVPRFNLSAAQLTSMGRFVHSEMNFVLTLNHPKISSYANYFLANVLEFGYGVEKNCTAAMRHVQLSADAGFAPAQCMLGLFYDLGEITRKNPTEALKWYKRSGDAGYPGALHNLAYCYNEGAGCTKNLAEAARVYQKAVDFGYVPSMGNLALLYRDGDGVPKDARKAVALFTRAAEKGCDSSQMFLGKCYEDGVGVTKSMSEAIKWYRLSVAQGKAGAKYYLAICYDRGNGVTKDSAQAMRLYEEAAAGGDEEAIFVIKEYSHYNVAYDLFQRIRFRYELEKYNTLVSAYREQGNVYAAGFQMQLHATKSMVNALKLKNSTAEEVGRSVLTHMTERSQFPHPTISAYAQLFAGLMYELGYGVTKNPQKAFDEFYLPSATSGYPLAQNAVGLCYTLGSGCRQSDAQSIPYFTYAARAGYSQSQHNLAYSYENGLGVAVDLAKAIDLYTKAADQGNLSSTLNLGCCYEDGRGVTQNWTKAVAYYRTAADQGEPQAQYNLALCYEQGLGVAKDRQQAKRYYQLAAAQNHVDAEEKLKKCVIS